MPGRDFTSKLDIDYCLLHFNSFVKSNTRRGDWAEQEIRIKRKDSNGMKILPGRADADKKTKKKKQETVSLNKHEAIITGGGELASGL